MIDDNSLNSFCESLQSLRPAREELDVRQVFFDAGRQAAQQQEQRSGSFSVFSFVAAVLAGMIVTAPLAYRAGQFRAEPLDSRVAVHAPPVPADTLTETSPLPEESIENSGPLANHVEASAESSRFASAPSPLASTFAGWLALDGRVAATQLDRAAQSTLSAFHASLVSREHVMCDLADFPFPVVEDSVVMAAQTDLGEQSDLAVRPLALGDRQLVFSSLEESR